MQGVNVFENGIGYMLRCLSLYTSGTGYFVMYLIALAVLIASATERDRKLFLLPGLCGIVTIYNPFVPAVLEKLFDVSSEYYRLFWIAPVIVLVPYALTTLIMRVKPGGERRFVTAVVIAAFVLGGNFVYADGIELAQNIYKIPDELIEISQIIHADSGSEYAKAFFEYDYNMEIRQYDPKMLLAIDREQYLYAVNYTYTDDMLGEDSDPANRILAPLVRNIKIRKSRFTGALEETKTQYVILSKGHPQAPFVKKCGLYEIAQTDTHVIYKYDLEDDTPFELVDYSDAEHRFSWRMLK